MKDYGTGKKLDVSNLMFIFSWFHLEAPFFRLGVFDFDFDENFTTIILSWCLSKILHEDTLAL